MPPDTRLFVGACMVSPLLLLLLLLPQQHSRHACLSVLALRLTRCHWQLAGCAAKAIAQQILNGFQLCSTSLCCAQADQVGDTFVEPCPSCSRSCYPTSCCCRHGSVHYSQRSFAWDALLEPANPAACGTQNARKAHRILATDVADASLT